MNFKDYVKYDSSVKSCLVNIKKRPPLRIGAMAGTLTKQGYYRLKLDGVNYYAHRIIWEIHNGPIPDGYYIDHIDRDKSNNKIENLRLATPAENVFNREPNEGNNSGYTGLSFYPERRKPWRVRLEGNGQNLDKYFSTVEAALSAAEKFKKDVHLDFKFS